MSTPSDVPGKSPLPNLGRLPRATHQGTIRFDGAAFSAFVIEGGSGLLGLDDVVAALGLDRPGLEDLVQVLGEPLEFTRRDGARDRGIPADRLLLACKTIIAMNDAGQLLPAQQTTFTRALRIHDDCLKRGRALLGGST